MTPDADLLSVYDARLRTALALRPPPGWACAWDGPLLRCTAPHRGFVGYRDLGGLEGAALDDLIRRTVAFYAARGEPFEWKTHAHDQPSDLPTRLRAAGFVPEARETVLMGEAATLAADVALPAGVTLRRVTAPADTAAIAALESEVWGEDWSWLAADLDARIASEGDDVAVLVAEAGGRVVSAAWLVVRPGTECAGLWGGSTLSAWRGRSIYRALVAARARYAVGRGVRYLQVDASEESRPILQRLGLRALTTTTPYVWTPPA